MASITTILDPIWYGSSGASPAEFERVEREIGVSFPHDYREIMLWSNGGECRLSKKGMKGYLSLWEIGEVPEAYGIRENLQGIVGIGTNGGDYCYAYDFRNKDRAPNLVFFDLGGYDFDSLEILSNSLGDWILKQLQKGTPESQNEGA